MHRSLLLAGATLLAVVASAGILSASASSSGSTPKRSRPRPHGPTRSSALHPQTTGSSTTATSRRPILVASTRSPRPMSAR